MKPLGLICFILIFFVTSCIEESIVEYEVTTIKNLNVYIIGEGSYFTLVEEELNGQLVLENDTMKIYYDIINGENQLNIPYGFYKGIIKGFEGCSYNNIDVVAMGNGDISYANTTICKFTKVNSYHINHEVSNNDIVNLIINTKEKIGYYSFHVWGSNEEGNQNESAYRDIIKITSFTEEGIAKIYLGHKENDEFYKYYNVSIHPLWGYADGIELKQNWYELIIE